MTLKLLYLVHVLATVIWVGGMFFAHQVLRPVAMAELEPPQRLRLWNGVFRRFFPWVWTAILALILTGQALALQLGGMAVVGLHVHIMAAVGYLMTAIFAYIYFKPYAALRRAVAAENWPAAGAAQNHIRPLVATNLSLGLANIILVFVLPVLI
ncbi:hypothetical protein EZJ19_02830 [Parasulfuritortus cantonensis]|uniref:Copper resistance protein D domain-containing protein n=1 Tax=Parasulfuritortus cantonensis TaxID=2528202 RepID=A0A4R1BLI8_9PROT|nr:CopD family protein [Parasulfuritortus cantonensis]TCJ18187.1 hypothetical protein EZJ19_02830 [Parasulfuritortus cantonensis]